MCVCMYRYMCVYIYIYIYIYMHLQYVICVKCLSERVYIILTSKSARINPLSEENRITHNDILHKSHDLSMQYILSIHNFRFIVK